MNVSSNTSKGLMLIGAVEDYCSHMKDRPVRIAHLCSEIGVSERAMRDTFHKLTAMSPLAYIKTMRLNRVYRELRDADPSEVLVKQVALSNGFVHFGQFSQDYKKLFSELPSETLQRR